MASIKVLNYSFATVRRGVNVNVKSIAIVVEEVLEVVAKVVNEMCGVTVSP